jgi:hypothetical protein
MRLRWPTLALPHQYDYEHVGDDVLVPRRIEGATFTYLADDDDTVILTVTVDAEMSNGHPVCTKISFEAGTQRLSRKLLSEFDPLWFVSWLLSTGGIVPKGGTEGDAFMPDPENALAALQRIPRRRTVDDARLTEVAAAYRRGGAAAVARDGGVTKSQAFRLVKQAREAGFLPAKGAQS